MNIESILRFVARLKHWQLFWLMVVPMLLAGLFFRPDIHFPDDLQSFPDQFTLMMYVAWPGYAVVYMWIWSVGIVGNSVLGADAKRSGRLALISAPTALAYASFAIWAFPIVIFDPDPGSAYPVMILAHLVASFLLIYSFFFAARAAASLGRNSAPSKGRVLLFFLAVFYFPIGVWIVQPKLNLVEPSFTLGNR